MMIKILSPQNRAVYQRDSNNERLISIFGTLKGFRKPPGSMKVYAQYFNPHTPAIKGDWVEMTRENRQFHGELVLPLGGWFQIRVESRMNGVVSLSHIVKKVGVGDIFITCGQSNSANHGEKKIMVEDDRISAWTGKRWQIANDPQPIATGEGGSPWPKFADELIKTTGVPIGLISVGVGGSPAADWKPQGPHYSLLSKAISKAREMGGVKAILWHQGESDSLAKSSTQEYFEMLMSTIDLSQRDVHAEVPWFIARASYHPDFEGDAMEAVAKAQIKLAEMDNIFAGPNTDELESPEWRHDGVHFNERGLIKHGQLWAERVKDALF